MAGKRKSWRRQLWSFFYRQQKTIRLHSPFCSSDPGAPSVRKIRYVMHAESWLRAPPDAALSRDSRGAQKISSDKTTLSVQANLTTCLPFLETANRGQLDRLVGSTQFMLPANFGAPSLRACLPSQIVQNDVGERR